MSDSNFKIRSYVQDLATIDTSKGIRVFYKGTPADNADPQFALTLTGSDQIDFLFYDGSKADSSVSDGTAGRLRFANADTLGKVVATINAQKYWGATLIAGLASDVLGSSGANLVAVSKATALPNGLIVPLNTVTTGTNAPGLVSVCLGPEVLNSTFGTISSLRSRSNAKTIWADPAATRAANDVKQPIDAVTILQRIQVVIAASTTAISLDVYDATDLGETKVRSYTPSASATTSYSLSDLNEEIMSVPGHRLVVRLEGATTLTGHTLTASGKTGYLAA